jgi:uncharacterized membrane protein YdjX (TVP38/TMEM64 family)
VANKALSQVRQQFKKYFKLLLLIGAIAIFFATPLRDLLNREILTAYLQKLGILAVPLFISTYILVTILGLPITVHTLTGGVVFGLVWGTIWSTLAATLGAIGSFWVTRYLFRDWAISKFGQNQLLAKWNLAIDRNPFNLVLSLRFAPIAPFNIVNFLLALTPLDLQTYSIATLVGVIPGTIAYTWLGCSGKTALQDRDYLQFVLASVLLVMLSVLPLWWQRRRRNKP